MVVLVESLSTMGVGSAFLKILSGLLQSIFSVSIAKLILEIERAKNVFIVSRRITCFRLEDEYSLNQKIARSNVNLQYL